MGNVKFVNCFKVYKPNDNAPDFVKANIVTNKTELLAWLKDQPEDIRLGIKESSKGTYYMAVNEYKPKEKTDLPF